MPGPTYVVQSNPRKTPASTVHDSELDADEFQIFGQTLANPQVVMAYHPNDEKTER